MVTRLVKIAILRHNDLLDFKLTENGGFYKFFQKMKIDAALNEVIEIMEHTIKGSDIKFVCDFKDLAVVECVGDKNRLQQVFMNLIQNSSKFAPKLNGTI